MILKFTMREHDLLDEYNTAMDFNKYHFDSTKELPHPLNPGRDGGWCWYIQPAITINLFPVSGGEAMAIYRADAS